jgi:DNA-binding LytR/AlgR family response regulator
MTLKCIVIDDEPIARKVLKEFIEDVDFLELAGEAENPVLAMPLINGRPIDLLFLDIDMPKVNGIDFIRSMRTEASCIITTAYAEYAAEAYGLDVLDYLVKPISFDRFLKACNKVLEWKALRQTSAGTGRLVDHFFVKCNSQIEKVKYDELIYAEAMLNYVMLYTVSRKMMVYVTMKGLEEQLPGDIFIKVHKSFIVNMNKIYSIEGNVLDMGGAKVAISQALREKVLNEVIKDRIIRR